MEDKILDYIVISVYLIFVALFGYFIGGKQRTVKDYFLGSNQVPWLAVCFSIVAAETSALTFISIPGLAYAANLNFLQITIGYLLGRIIVAAVFLPAYRKGELKTAYSYLAGRFGEKTRSMASVVFIFTRVAADGVRLFAAAIPLKLMLNIDYPLAIALIALVTFFYTYTGGLKGIIWVDAVQMFIYLGGAILAGAVLIYNLPDGFNSVISSAGAENKFDVINPGLGNGLKGFFDQPYTLLGGIIGGAFLSMASHGTDQLIVQRLLAAKNLKDSQKAVIGTGFIIILQFALFLVLGVMLYAYYGRIDVKPDEVFPMFIINVIPHGISGIIIAGLFAAAMSTLAGSISSLSSSTLIDLFIPMFGKINDNKRELRLSRMFTIFWTVILLFAAMFFMNTASSVVEIALSIASFTYGGLLGTFLLGIFIKRAAQKDAIAGFAAGILIMIIVIAFKLTAWTWFTLIGVITTITTGAVFSLFKKPVQ